MAQIQVDSVAALTGALKTAQSGDTILLASGTYSGATFNGLSFASGVTITSADPAHQAALTNFNITNCNGLTFTNLDLAAQPATYAYIINGSGNITFDHVSVHGSLDGNAGNDPSGLQVMNSHDITIVNSEFQQLARGLVVGSTSNLVVADNYVHHVRTDGFDFAEVAYAKITGNVLTDFSPVAGDHPDAIQFWTQGTKTASHDVVISGNLILRGDGAPTQGIFMGDEVGTLPYERFTISDNMIVGTGLNALRIYGGKDLTLTNNELVSFAGEDKTYILLQLVNGANVTGNDAILIGYDRVTNLTQGDNTLTTAVADGGSAALSDWFSLHPEDKAMLDGAPLPTATEPDPIVTDPIVTDPVVTTPPPSDSTATEPPPVSAPSEPVVVQTGTSPDATGTGANETLLGDYRVNHLYGMGGDDTLNGSGGADSLYGGAGDDTYIVPNSQAVVIEKAGEGIDTVIAKGDHVLEANVENLQISTEAGNGWLGRGNALDNHITGNRGNNLLEGMGGNDTIVGGEGKDVIVGGAGNDRLTGGEDGDTFRFSPGGGNDVVTDPGSGNGREYIDVSAYLKAGLSPVLHDVGSDVVISFSNGDSITLLGVHAADMHSTSSGWVF